MAVPYTDTLSRRSESQSLSRAAICRLLLRTLRSRRPHVFPVTSFTTIAHANIGFFFYTTPPPSSKVGSHDNRSTDITPCTASNLGTTRAASTAHLGTLIAACRECKPPVRGTPNCHCMPQALRARQSCEPVVWARPVCVQQARHAGHPWSAQQALLARQVRLAAAKHCISAPLHARQSNYRTAVHSKRAQHSKTAIQIGTVCQGVPRSSYAIAVFAAKVRNCPSRRCAVGTPCAPVLVCPARSHCTPLCLPASCPACTTRWQGVTATRQAHLALQARLAQQQALLARQCWCSQQAVRIKPCCHSLHVVSQYACFMPRKHYSMYALRTVPALHNNTPCAPALFCTASTPCATFMLCTAKSSCAPVLVCIASSRWRCVAVPACVLPCLHNKMARRDCNTAGTSRTAGPATSTRPGLHSQKGLPRQPMFSAHRQSAHPAQYKHTMLPA